MTSEIARETRPMVFMGMKNRGVRYEMLISLVLLVASAAGMMGMVVMNYTRREMVMLKVEIGLTLVEALENRLETNEGRSGYQPQRADHGGHGFRAGIDRR